MIDIDGVKIFGEAAGEMQLEEIWSLQVPPEALLHVTRHLSVVSSAARKQLCRYTNASFVDAQLQTLGSKFHERIDNPEIITAFAARRLTEVVTDARIPWVKQNNRFIAMKRITITSEQKQELGLAPHEPLGFSSVVPITSENAHLVTRRQRGKGEADDHLMVNVIPAPAVPCDDLIVAVRKDSIDGPMIFVSTYVGIISPSLPRKTVQTPEEYAWNSEWWLRHAFIG